MPLWSLFRFSATAALDALAPSPPLRSGPRPDEPRGLLFLSQVIWLHVWGRPQEIAERLAPKIPVTFLGPTPVHRMLEARHTWRAHETRCGGRLQVRSPLTVPGEYRSALIRRFDAWHVLKTIRRLRLVPEETVLLLSSPFSPGVVERIPWGLVVYDWMDDFAEFAWAPRSAGRLTQRTISRVDLFTAGTQFLAETKRAQCREVHFVPNGVRFEAFAAGNPPRPADLPSGFDHVLGYIGTLSDRFDTELVEAVAQAFPRAAVVLIGPRHGSLGRAPRRENILLLGPRPHAELPAYVRHFDVGLIPFRAGPGAQAVNPTKLLEYAAAGVPVVSTALPDVEALFADCVGIARTPARFIEEIRRALDGEMTAEIARARERARAASWEETANRLWDLICGAWRRKGASGAKSVA
jgi:UDP-galactopyranose mutase